MEVKPQSSGVFTITTIKNTKRIFTRKCLENNTCISVPYCLVSFFLSYYFLFSLLFYVFFLKKLHPFLLLGNLNQISTVSIVFIFNLAIFFVLTIRVIPCIVILSFSKCNEINKRLGCACCK